MAAASPAPPSSRAAAAAPSSGTATSCRPDRGAPARRPHPGGERRLPDGSGPACRVGRRGRWHQRTTASGTRGASGERDYTYPLEQRAATLWYHDHRMDFTGPQVWRGLAGFHLVHDDEEDALPCPCGDRDIPLMITDRSFAPTARSRYPLLDPSLRASPASRTGTWTGCWVTSSWSTARRGPRSRSNGRATGCGSSTPPTPADTGWSSTRSRRAAARSCRSAATAACSTAPVAPRRHRHRPGRAVRRHRRLLPLPRPARRCDLLNRLGERPDRRGDAVRRRPRARTDDARCRRGSSTIERLDPAAGRDRVDLPLQHSADHGWTINGAAVSTRRRPPARPRLGDHRDLAVHHRRPPPGPRPPRPVPGAEPRQPRARPVRRRLEGHRGRAPCRGSRGRGAVHGLRRARSCCTATTWSTRTWR